MEWIYRVISVITVCFNAEKYIEKTIVSVLQQKCIDYEYIFIDGLSSDRTLEIINKYAPMFRKSGVTVTIISESDAGIYDAMNKGARLAKGQWVNFLNAGDRYHDEEVLGKVVSSMNKREAEIYVGNIVYVEGFLGKRYEHEIIDNLKERMIFCHQAVFADTSLFQKKQFDLRYKYSADYDWILYMFMKRYNFCYLDVIISDYDSTGVSNQNSMQTLMEAKKIRKKYGFESNLDGVKTQINWKYKIYKIIAKNKVFAALYYKFYGHNKTNIFFFNNRER